MDPLERRRPGYGVVLLLIVASMAVSTAAGSDDALAAASVATRGATLIAVVITAGFSRRLVLATWILAALALLGTLGWSLAGALPRDAWAAASVDVLLVAAAPFVIAKDLARDPVVDRQTVTGALCIYLLIGLFFASLYSVIAVLGSTPVFASGDGTPADRLYFSLVTLTTTGYGDLVPGSGVTRTAATVEALMGQLYLVTVVALAVGRLGHKRRAGTSDETAGNPAEPS